MTHFLQSRDKIRTLQNLRLKDRVKASWPKILRHVSVKTKEVMYTGSFKYVRIHTNTFVNFYKKQ